MSKTLYDGNSFSVNQFWGGEKEKVSIQITDKNGYVQLNKREVKKLINILNKWLEEIKK